MWTDSCLQAQLDFEIKVMRVYRVVCLQIHVWDLHAAELVTVLTASAQKRADAWHESLEGTRIVPSLLALVLPFLAHMFWIEPFYLMV